MIRPLKSTCAESTKTAGLKQAQGPAQVTPAAIPDGDPMQTLRIEFCRMLRAGQSVPPRTYRQWLEECVIIPDGKHRGKRFKVDRQPVMGLFIDAVDSGEYNEFVFTAPSQFGKTLVAFVGPVLYHSCEVGENYVLGVPFGDMASDKWDLDVKPVMKASHHLRRLLPASGSGSAGGKVRERITLRNGVEIKLMSAGAQDQGKAGFTARVVGITEAAAFSVPGNASDEADPLRQLRARQRSYTDPERTTYIEGTVTIEDALPWTLYPTSTQSKIVSPCPHCREWIAPERDDLIGWDDAKSDREAMLSAFWACPECGQKITEEERHASVRQAKLLHAGQKIDKRGRITGKAPDTSRLWFRATAFHNLFLDAGSIGKDEWLAKQIPEDSAERISADRQLCQFVHCVPYEDPRFLQNLELDKKRINRRRIDHLPHLVLPADTQWTAAGVDVGQYVAWYQVWALRKGATGDLYWHVPTYGQVEVPSDRMKLDDAIQVALREIHTLLQAGMVVEGTSTFRRPDNVWYDANWRPDPVLGFVREINAELGMPAAKRKYTPWVAAYGRGVTTMANARYSAPRKTNNVVRDIDPAGLWYLEKIQRAKTFAVFWDSDTTKWELQQSLTLELFGDSEQQTPGSVTLYAGTSKIHERCVTHWVNERLETVVTVGGEKRKWVRHGANHLLDCGAMARRGISRAQHIAKKTLYLPPTLEATEREAWLAEQQEKHSVATSLAVAPALAVDPSPPVASPTSPTSGRAPKPSLDSARTPAPKGGASWYDR